MNIKGIIESLRDLFRPSTFKDFDYSPDDEFLDHAFKLDEKLRSPQLTSQVLNGGRIPWNDIIPLLPSNISVVFEPGWNTRGAPVMSPIGQFCHWTAGRPTAKNPAPSLSICINGRTGIPGPLCNCMIDYNGVIHVISSGRANHAGTGDQSVLNLVRNHKDLNGKPGPDTGGSGGSFIGYEIEHSGKGAFQAKQIEAVTQLIRATAMNYGWQPELNTIDHARWTRRKIDIRGCNPWPTPDIMRNAVRLPTRPKFILQIGTTLNRWDGAVVNGKRQFTYIGDIREVERLLGLGYRQVKYSG